MSAYADVNWNIVIKDDLVTLPGFSWFELDIGRFNYGIITLLPKVKEANKIQQT